MIVMLAARRCTMIARGHSKNSIFKSMSLWLQKKCKRFLQVSHLFIKISPIHYNKGKIWAKMKFGNIVPYIKFFVEIVSLVLSVSEV